MVSRALMRLKPLSDVADGFLRDDVDALVCHRATSSRGLHDLLPLPSFRALRFLPAIFFPPTPPPRADLNFDTRPSILVAAILFFLFFFS